MTTQDTFEPYKLVGPARRFGKWVAGLGPGAIPLGAAVACLIGFGLPLILVLANGVPGATEAWPPVEAKVVEIKKFKSVEIDEDTKRRSNVTNYQTIARYTVDGEVYERNVSFDGWRHQVGDTLTVYYDPADPRDASVNRPSSGAEVPWVLGGLGGGFVLLFGIGGLVLVGKGVSWGPRSGTSGARWAGQGQQPSAAAWTSKLGTKPDFPQYRPESDSAVDDGHGS